MRGGGTINADGFGIGWLPPAGSGESEPDGGSVVRRYRRDIPMWADAGLPDLAASISSTAILAAVRSATAGMPVTETACAPFVEGIWMFSHNGVIDGWPDSVASLAQALPASALMTLEAPTDSAFLWALVREHLRQGRPAARILSGVAGDVLALAPGSRMNLILNDCRQIVATTVVHSLWYRQAEGSVLVSSEALDPDDRAWQPVPDRCLLEATASDISMRALDQGWT